MFAGQSDRGDGTHETYDLTSHENQQNRSRPHVNSSHCRIQSMHWNTSKSILAILYQIQKVRQAGPCQVSTQPGSSLRGRLCRSRSLKPALPSQAGSESLHFQEQRDQIGRIMLFSYHDAIDA